MKKHSTAGPRPTSEQTALRVQTGMLSLARGVRLFILCFQYVDSVVKWGSVSQRGMARPHPKCKNPACYEMLHMASGLDR